MLIIGILLFGILVGAGAQLILGTAVARLDWTFAFIAGITGSLVGGLLASMVAGDGVSLRPSGILGSLIGAVIVTAVWQQYRRRKAGTAERSPER
ncbi:GlsB/YeaQ/YmgE family stress response membrane protein [Rhodococcus marinonascens]|uniref:GlsB/YeaQ/YmgE family stress response membrane protein n=1 Tax=Rhodococcus marinonascens TaxID=38311 RepID=UPI000933D869|nr:GlsB/YeaQ/YmgE family stress response membrane protein [Rhodococcus marinonascens]